jgi:hypothetical protein
MARSRRVRSAASRASTCAGSRIRGSVRPVRTSGTPCRGRCRSRRVGNPRGTGLAATSPRVCRNANSPDTLDRRRRTVRADTPTWSLATVCSRRTAPPVYCAVMNANTSAAVTSAGGLPTTVKNTFRS